MFSFKKRKLTINEYAKKYEDSSKKIENILINIGYIKKENKWVITTKLGKLMGIEEIYNPKNKLKFVLIPDGIHKGIDFKKEYYKLSKYENLKKQNTKNKIFNKKQKMTNKEKEEKGKIYEIYIGNFYKKQNYTIANHGIDNKEKDAGIDIIAKKDKTILFIQCKNWNIKNKKRITHVDIKKTRTEINDYIEKNPLYENYKIKTLYITSEDILDKSAKYYIKEHNEKIEYKIIPIK